MASKKLPYVDLALIEYLEAFNPDRFPSVELSSYEQGKKAGALELIRHLRRIYEDNVKSSLGELPDVHGR